MMIDCFFNVQNPSVRLNIIDEFLLRESNQALESQFISFFPFMVVYAVRMQGFNHLGYMSHTRKLATFGRPNPPWRRDHKSY